MSSITINGKNSYTDFGALLTSRSTPPPNIRDISATIPYRNGDICFTYQNGGKPTYDTRTLTYKFVFMDCPKTALRKTVADFENWILSAGECDLYDDAEIYHYKARAISCAESEKGYHVEVTATFKAQPYKISDDFSDKGFDDFSFENDCLNLTNMTLTAIKMAPHAPMGVLRIYLYSDVPIKPRLIYRRSADDTDKVGFTYFQNNNIDISEKVYRPTEKPFDMDELILQPGLNTLSAYGFGSLTLSLHEEVL